MTMGEQEMRRFSQDNPDLHLPGSRPDDAETVHVAEEQLGEPVDLPDEGRTIYATAMRAETAQLLPIVPAWVRSKSERRQVAKAVTKMWAYTVGYHSFWSPKYALRVTYRAPIGAARLVARWYRLVFDKEAAPLRAEAIRKADYGAYKDLDNRRNDRVKLRLIASGALAVPVVAGASAGVALAPSWALWAVLSAAVVALGHLGSPIGKPITDRVSQSSKYIRLTAEITRNAIIACGVGVKDAADLRFPREIYRDPPGHTAVVDLPPGVIAMDVVNKREQLAGAFRLPKQQVWPQHVRGEHPGRLQIWVADKPVNEMRAPAWPLLKDGTTDYFKPFPIGTDERMRRVDMLLAEKNSLFAATPGAGKSLSARVYALGGALDPLVDFIIFDLKGLGDFDPLEPLCLDDMYGSSPDEETKLAAMQALEWLYEECGRRAPLVKGYVKRGVNNENKVNRAMAERDPRLRPIMAIFDEIQELVTDPEHGKRAKFLLVSIVKRGRAMGVHLVLATQRLDKPSLPREITSNIAIRTCLSVPSHVECDLVLGTGMYSRGARPTEFQPGAPKDGGDSGWGYRSGYGQMGVVRHSYISNEQAAAVVKRALALREGLSRRGEPEKVKSRNVLADVKSVLMPGEDALWSELIIARLVELAPDMYGGLTVEAFGALMTAAGLRTVSIHRKIDGKGWTKRGVQREALEAAIGAKQLQS